MKYNPDIHHRRSVRLKGFDYTQPGAYFVTMVCRDRELLLESDVSAGIVRSVWNSLPRRFPSVELDEFIVMPNHVHGIIVITDNKATASVGAIHELPLQNNWKQRWIMTLPKVIGYLKMNTAKRSNQLNQRSGQPLWQRNYYEHIIRTEDELNCIRQYILNNPFTWETDEENPNRGKGAVLGVKYLKAKWIKASRKWKRMKK